VRPSYSAPQALEDQELLAEIGVMALQGGGFERLLAETVRLTAHGMEAEFCKILEHIPDENRFLVRAGLGWEPGIVGKATVGADLESPAGFALQTGQPVISNHLENEQRFRTPELLVRHAAGGSTERSLPCSMECTTAKKGRAATEVSPPNMPVWPPRQPRLHLMRGIACGRLLSLREYQLLVTEKNGPERLALPSRRAKMTRVKRFALSGQLDNRLIQRNRAVHGRSGTDHAVASNHGSFYRLPACQLDHQRDDAAVREIDTLNFVARCIQNGLVLELDGLEVRPQ
jgi:hypothetical protein